MALFGPLIDDADAAIIMEDAPFGFGCVGCARTNELCMFNIRQRNIPVLEVKYPTSSDETMELVNRINEFLDSLGKKMVKIAQISCGTEYSGIQDEIDKAASTFGAEILIPDVELDYINEAYKKFGFIAASSGIRLMIARAMSIVEGKTDADAVFIATCFRCAEGALLRNQIRRFIQQNTNLPVVTYSFTERTKADELFIRMEALATIVARKSLLAREKQEGLTLGIDSGSTTTKVVLMENNEIIGTGWLPTTDVIENEGNQKRTGRHSGTKNQILKLWCNRYEG